MENKSVLYSALTRFGDHYPLKVKGSVDNIINLLEENFSWVQYNPRKKIDRYGLSVTSLDGGITGKPDLDSLGQYYIESGQLLTERDFNKKTVIYQYFKNWLAPFDNYLGRTHVIKLNPGGYFPPHRDNKTANIDSFRLILPLNYNYKSHFFLLEDKRIHFENGAVHFVDTAKVHTLFNTAEKPFYFLVVNVNLEESSVKIVTSFLFG